MRNLQRQLQQTNPGYAATLASQYAADLGSVPDRAPPIPSQLPMLARQMLGSARQWSADAALTAIAVQSYTQYAYAVSVGNAYIFNFTFVSPSAGQVLTATFSQAGYQDHPDPLRDNVLGRPLPDSFIDLPDALERARMRGMREPLDHALLAVWQPPRGGEVLAWIISDRRLNTYAIDAISGGSYRPENLFGPIPGNDAQLRAAVAKAKEALAAPPPAPAGPAQGVPVVHSRCIMCEIQAGQARQYIINHPAASMGEAMAAVSH